MVEVKRSAPLLALFLCHSSIMHSRRVEHVIKMSHVQTKVFGKSDNITVTTSSFIAHP